jgi:hypothetical protein
MVTNDGENAGSVLPRSIDRNSAERIVRATVHDAGLTVQALKNDLVITNPHDPEKGLVRVDYATGFVTWERPSQDFWGVLEGYQAEEPPEDESTVTLATIVATLTDSPQS